MSDADFIKAQHISATVFENLLRFVRARVPDNTLRLTLLCVAQRIKDYTQLMKFIVPESPPADPISVDIVPSSDCEDDADVAC